ncbi:MAG: MFS transporter [Thermodesulfobacteriota bacterium]
MPFFFKLPKFIRTNPKLAFFALAATATSGFGQTFFVSVVGGEVREAFGLSHTFYGGIYSTATILSACLLFRFGRLADTWPLAKVTSLAVALLALGCLLVGTAPGVLVLGLGFILIRFGGQGFIAHLGVTTAARYFHDHRGKAVALATAGIPLAEAILPASAVFLINFQGWRAPWLTGSILLVLLILPLLLFLSGRTPAPEQDQSITGGTGKNFSYTREQVLKDTGFYLILPSTVAAPFVVTAILFHQAAIADIHGWPLQLVGSAFSAYAAGHLASLAAAGPLVDRIGSGRALSLALLPMIAGLLLLGLGRGNWLAYVYLGLIGITQGFASTAAGSVWAERYGVLYLGAIRSMVQAIMVVTTAIAPVVLGFLLDQGLSLSLLMTILAGGTLLCSGLTCLTREVKINHDSIAHK